MNIYSINAYQHAMKYGAPALARFIAQRNFYQTRINGDMVGNAKWCQRQVVALNAQWDANDTLAAKGAN